MSKVINEAVDFMVDVAKDSKHGYSQLHRNGKPDYDCSSLVIAAFKHAGLDLAKLGAYNTRTLHDALIKAGFVDVTKKVDLDTGIATKKGDVLLAPGRHVAVSVSSRKMVHASIDEKGGIKGATPGDQTGKEICVRSYHNHPWKYVLRYSK